MKKPLGHYTLNNFNTPYGTINNARATIKRDGSDIITPFPNHVDKDTRGLHHHLYLDSQRRDAIGLGYTRQQDGKTWREYYLDKGNGWERDLDPKHDSSKYNSVRERNRASNERGVERAHRLKANSLSIQRASETNPTQSANQLKETASIKNKQQKRLENMKSKFGPSASTSPTNPGKPRSPTFPTSRSTPTLNR